MNALAVILEGAVTAIGKGAVQSRHSGSRHMALMCLLLGLGSASATAQPPVDITKFAGADRVRITGNHVAGTDDDTRDITDAEQIEVIYRFAQSTPGKWRRPKFIPAPLLYWNVEFYQGDKLIGFYGVGSNFVAAGGYYLSLRPQQRRAIAMALSSHHSAT